MKNIQVPMGRLYTATPPMSGHPCDAVNGGPPNSGCLVSSGRRGGLMVSALVSRSSSLGMSPGQRHCCCVLGQDTLLSQCLSPPRRRNGDWQI